MRFITAASTVALAGLLLAGCTSPAQEQAERRASALASATAVASPFPSETVSADPEPAPTRVDLPEPNKPKVAEVTRNPSGTYLTKTAYAAVTTTAAPSSAKPSEAKKTPPSIAFAGADKDASKDAIVLTKNVAGAYAITTPSGNINCQFGTEFEGCGLVSFQQEGRYRDGDTVKWFVRFNGDKEPSIINLPGNPAYMSGATPLEYGKQAKADDYVCASEDTGVTCWNTKTKRGFFVNRDGYETFNSAK